MTQCRRIYDDVRCADDASNVIHGYPMCDACAYETLQTTPLRHFKVPEGPVDFSFLTEGSGK